ncbi:MAG: diguanylate cyclase [Planctomycetes bacterium]|nr:diguanylate cyclase [Planctomycetota bacterium]
MTKPEVGVAPGAGEEPVVVTESLAELVYRDDLTRIRNRRYFFKYLREEIVWNDPAGSPVSLLMIDLDHFKTINDHFGHLEGDHALVHVSQIFCDHVKDPGVVVRYAGDEFAVVLPGSPKSEARLIADDLLDEVRRRALALPGGKGSLPLTLSIGVATFPDDGDRPEALIESADRALYVSKRRGRDQVSVHERSESSASSPDPPVEQLPCKKLIAREEIREQFRSLLTRSGGSRAADAPLRALLLVRGDVGSGKTRLLSNLREMATTANATVLWASLQEQDARQPLSAMAALVGPLWRGELGPKLREVLEQDELRAVRALVGETADAPPTPADLTSILGSTLPRMLGAAAGSRGRVIFLDDLQFIDRESLELLLRALESSKLPFLVVATVREEALAANPPHECLGALLEWVPTGGSSRYDVQLRPFTVSQTRELLEAAFPGIEPDAAAVEKLAHVSGGNPLFLEALLRWLAASHAIRRTKHGFELGPIADWSLPSTLDEAVRAAWTNVDRDTERVVQSAALIGSKFDLKMLRNVTGMGESEILEFLDRAAGHNLVRAANPFNVDEFVFASNRFRELKESETPDDRRAELHERIARAEEEKHRTGLEAIIGRLAYHYGRSRNRDRAAYYGAALDRWRGGVVPQGGVIPRSSRARIPEADAPLTERETTLLKDVFRFFSAAIKNRALYPPGSRMIATSLEDLRRAMSRVFETCVVFTISSAHEDLVVNGATIDPRRFVAGAREFLDLLKNFHIRSLTIARDVEARELEGFIEIVCGRSEPVYDPEYWDRKLDEKGIQHLSVDQRLYVVAGASAAAAAGDMANVSSSPEPAPWVGDPTLAAALEQYIREMGVAPDLQASIDHWSREASHGSDLPARLVGELGKPDPRTRLDALRVLRGVLGKLASKVEASWMKATEDALLARFATDGDPAVVSEMAALLAELVQYRLRRGEGAAAVRLVQTLTDRVQGNGRTLGRDGEVRERLKDLCKGATFELLAADLTNGDPKRNSDALAVVRAMGDQALPALIRLIQSRDDLRVRQVAAEQIRELGVKAVAEVRRAVSPGTPEQDLRRLIGVLDILGADFTEELKLALVQPSRAVRLEAAQVLARLPIDQVAVFLEPLAHPERTIAVEALVQLGRIRRRETTDAIVRRMRNGGEEDVLYEGCLTLGKIGDPRVVPELARYLLSSKLVVLGPRYPERVRYAAAWALTQFGTAEAREALRRAENDRSPLVRPLVQKALETSRPA